MNRHKHADLIHAWADGAEIQFKGLEGWFDVCNPNWLDDTEYRIKPKEPNWWENIPKQGVLCWVDDYGTDPKLGLINVVTKVGSGDYRRFVDVNDTRWQYATPLTNEEIEAFKR